MLLVPIFQWYFNGPASSGLLDNTNTPSLSIFYLKLQDPNKPKSVERFDSPLVAAVIPTFNPSQSLPRALNSLERQSLKIFEVVVVDDGSSDDTEEVVKTFKSRLCLGSLKIRPSGGRTRPNSKGVPRSRRGYVAVLGSNDYWYEDELAQSVGVTTTGAVFSYHDGLKRFEGASRPAGKSRVGSYRVVHSRIC